MNGSVGFGNELRKHFKYNKKPLEGFILSLNVIKKDRFAGELRIDYIVVSLTRSFVFCSFSYPRPTMF